MPSGGKRLTSFKKGDPRASAAGKKTNGHLPQHVKDARKFNAIQFEDCLYKYMSLTYDELNKIFNDKKTSARDMAVIKILIKAIKEGDYRAFEFLLDRTIGKLQHNVKIEVEAKTVTDLLMESNEIDIIDVNPRSKITK
jgi:hypothetical protein